jgi:hypothetical protein
MQILAGLVYVHVCTHTKKVCETVDMFICFTIVTILVPIGIPINKVYFL